MKLAFVMAFLLGAVCMVMSQKQTIKTKSTANVDAVLINNRVLTNYLNCLLDKGPCSREGTQLKSELFFLSIFKTLNFKLFFLNQVRQYRGNSQILTSILIFFKSLNVLLN